MSLGKKLFISGGGDSALDWAIYFAENHNIPVGLAHRTDMFRGHKDSVEKIYDLQKQGKIELYTHAEVVGLTGSETLEQIELKQKDNDNIKIDLDYWLPLFGLSPKLGPIGDWGLEIEKNAIKVDNTLDYQTNIPGVFAIGDVNTYPGKLKLILCGFHEAAIMVQSAFKKVYPNKNNVLKYTTVTGIKGF